MVEFTLRRTRSRAKYPNRIREYRLRAGFSQKRLGELLGKGRCLVSLWERGRRLPSLPNVFRLAKTLGTLSEALYGALYSPKSEDESTDAKKK